MSKSFIENQWYFINTLDVKTSYPVSEKLLCKFCHKLLINGHIAPCGCRFCEKCCTEWLVNKNQPCPNCKIGKIKNMKDFEIDYNTNMKVLSLVVKCPNLLCDVECELKSIGNHLNECPSAKQKVSKRNSLSSIPENVNGNFHPTNLEKQVMILIENERQTKIDLRKLKQKLQICKKELKDFKEEFIGNQICLESLEHAIEQLKDENESLKKLIAKDIPSPITLSPTYNLHKPKPFIWRVNEFSIKQQNAKSLGEISIFSDPFYSHFNGYKLCLGMYPNGTKQYEGKYLFVFFCILQSSNDINLKWPMQYQISLSILDQNSLKDYKVFKFKYETSSQSCQHSFFKPTSTRNEGIGDNEFISFRELNSKNNILKNDSILIKCVVDADWNRNF